jgi:hypothetical protein
VEAAVFMSMAERKDQLQGSGGASCVNMAGGSNAQGVRRSVGICDKMAGVKEAMQEVTKRRYVIMAGRKQYCVEILKQIVLVLTGRGIVGSIDFTMFRLHITPLTPKQHQL